MGGIEWARNLTDVEMKLAVFKILHNQMESKGHTDHPLMVLLWKYSRDLPAGHDVRKRIKQDGHKLVVRLVQEIEQKQYLTTLSSDFGGWVEEILPFMLPFFDMSNVERFLLLVNFSQKNQEIGNYHVCSYLTDALFNSLEENLLLGSEQALHLMVHTKVLKQDMDMYGQRYYNHIKKKIDDAFKKLNNMKFGLFLHYQRYIEDLSREKLGYLHIKNPHLSLAVEDFIDWYCNGEDLKRFATVLPAAKIATECQKKDTTLKLMHSKMVQNELMNTFEAFSLLNEFNNVGTLHTVSAPDCVRTILHGCSVRGPSPMLFLINKCNFMGSTLSTHQQKLVLCSDVQDDKKQLWTVTINDITALISFHAKSFVLTTSPLDRVVKLAKKIGTDFRIKAVDKDHFKIFTEDGEKYCITLFFWIVRHSFIIVAFTGCKN